MRTFSVNSGSTYDGSGPLSVWSGNVQAWLIPLMLSRMAPVAVLAKYYAAVPLVVLGQWRPLLVALGITVLTVPLLPWATFIDDLPIIADLFPNGKVVTIKNAGHWVHAEQPEAFLQTVNAFLK